MNEKIREAIKAIKEKLGFDLEPAVEINSWCGDTESGFYTEYDIDMDALNVEIDRFQAELAARATPAQPVPEKHPLFYRKLADLQQRGYQVFGHILHKNGEYALFDDSCRWLTQPQYWRLMHEQDGSLFATPSLASDVSAPSPSSVGAAIRALPLPEDTYLGGDEAYGDVVRGYTADQVRALLSEAAALAEQVQGQQWISIADKMPESGKRVVFAWTNQLGKARTSMGQWNERWKQVANSSDEDACEYDEELDEYYLLEGWQEWGWELEFSAYVEGKVTHWMPLPAAPSIAQDGQKSEGV